MSFRLLTALLTVPARPRAQVLAALAVAALTVSTVSHAQQPASPPGGMPAETQEQLNKQQVELIYTPWTKYCLKAPDGKQTCFIGKDGRIESGQAVIAAVIIEPEGDSKKILRVTLPLGMQLVHGTRVFVDNSPPAQGPYVICFGNGCISDYEVTPELLAGMKNGQNLVVQAINANNAVVALPLPLQETSGGFARAYDGVPPDPKFVEDNYKKVQEELQRRASEAHRKAGEAEPPAAAMTPAPAEK